MRSPAARTYHPSQRWRETSPGPFASATISLGRTRMLPIFRLRNMGNIRVRPSEIVAEAKGPGDVSRQRWDGWYVLAAGDRIYEWALPKNVCPQIRSVHIE